VTRALRQALLGWYGERQRDLPWRRTTDPYRIWVSEVMLQQTTVRVVGPFYEAFVGRFPDIRSLAAAGEEQVLAAWSGLGYYRRARNLHRAARHLVEHHAGEFPRALEAALAVPGVGLYTASAVLSIAYGLPLAVVDGNVRRVLARLFALHGEGYRRQPAWYERATELLDESRPGDWNQAVMELGATVCLPRKPACDICPLSSRCAALDQGLVDVLPEARPRRRPVDVSVAAALVEENGRFLLVRRPQGRVLGRMWEVPQTSLESAGLPDLTRELADRHGLHVVPGPLRVRARHAITFRRIAADGYAARLAAPPPADTERVRWVHPDEIAALPVSSLTRKLIDGLRAAQMALPL
jgi:A/G-specific adenine glycosylase